MRYEIGRILKKERVMELVSGYCPEPKSLLGRHLTERGQVITAYHPKAVNMWILEEGGRIHEMDMVERQPVFAVFLPHREEFPYQIEIQLEDGTRRTYYDAYSFSCQISEEEEEAFCRGEWLEAHKKMGCHAMTIQGVKGVYFAVWAPQTRSVSLVGDFNHWNSKLCPMNRMPRSNIYEIFIPGAEEGLRYRFEPKTILGEEWKISDSYGVALESEMKNTSKMLNMSNFRWEDGDWMRGRSKTGKENQPLVICNFFEKRKNETDYVLKNTFTHVLIRTGKGGEEMLRAAYVGERGFFVPPLHGDDPRGFQEFVQEAHQNGVGVLMEVFFEAFNYNRPETMSYLLSNLLFWIREYHIDGFVFEGVSKAVEEPRDIFGNVDMVKGMSGFRKPMGEEQRQEFIQKAVDIIKEEDAGIIIISGEGNEQDEPEKKKSSPAGKIDFFWDYDIGKGLEKYFASPGEERKKEHFNLTLPLQRGGLGRSVHLLEYKEMDCLCQTPIDKMDEVYYDRLSEAKLFFAFLMGVPGKKILPDYCDRSRACVYLHSLLKLYRTYPALYESGEEGQGFEWVNGMDAESSVFSFIRKSASDSRRLLFVCNFNKHPVEDYSVGVPAEGDYRLVSNSDEERFGGMERFTARVLHAEKYPRDFRPYSVSMTLPSETVLIFEFREQETVSSTSC